jgi:GNAT superfamily N-acetyltransferase
MCDCLAGPRRATYTFASVRFERLRDCTTPHFEALLRIYRDAIPESERKQDATLRAMLESDDYEFLVALDDHDVQGFSIVKRFSDADGCLLEYMAVDRLHRGRGVGGRLFRAASTTPAVAMRHMLLEVESEGAEGVDRAVRGRRKAFYRALGCRELAGLVYLMPSVAVSRPPAMNLLIYSATLPPAIDKPRLRRWLECIYSEVYHVSGDDPRIASMLGSLPDRIPLQ